MGPDRVDVVRHPAEIPLLVIGTILLVAILSGLGILVALTVGGLWLLVLGLLFIGLYVGRGFLQAVERTRSVLIGPNQFPQLHERIRHFADSIVIALPCSIGLVGGQPVGDPQPAVVLFIRVFWCHLFENSQS